MVLLETEITPVDSTVETLKVQLLCLTLVMAVLGLGLALFIARRIARPLAAINQSAKKLGEGDYAIRFEGAGTREAAELAQTLNYAAGELSKVDELRRELLANVSHDLRTPLTMIEGYAEVMPGPCRGEHPENVQIIIDETQRLTNLVNDLLDLSKLEAGVVPLDKTRFNLTDSIRRTLQRYDKLADYRFPFYADRDVFVTADELRISQVVYNLVNNAITYAGADKTITLRQTVGDGMVRISVTDTGEGIPAISSGTSGSATIRWINPTNGPRSAPPGALHREKRHGPPRRPLRRGGASWAWEAPSGSPSPSPGSDPRATPCPPPAARPPAGGRLGSAHARRCPSILPLTGE